MKRKKPIFFRQGWDRYMRLGKTQKKKRKWRAAKGGDSKTRMKERGKPARPTIGWGSSKELRNKINGFSATRIENIKQLESLQKGQGIIVASVGKKKRTEILSKANQMGLKILNKYKENKDATK